VSWGMRYCVAGFFRGGKEGVMGSGGWGFGEGDGGWRRWGRWGIGGGGWGVGGWRGAGG